jgi:hypothetical protein
MKSNKRRERPGNLFAVSVDLHKNCRAERDALKAQLQAATERAERAEAFARKLFEATDWPEGGDIDGGAFQELAIEHGFLTPETRNEPCGEVCFCAEYYGPDELAEGVTCYRKTAALEETHE